MDLPIDRRSWRRAVARVLLIALLARGAVFVYALYDPDRFVYPDSRRYVAVARNIAAGRGPIESDLVLCGNDPLYPALLSVGVRLGIESFERIMDWGRGVNVVLGLAAIPAVMLLGRRAGGSTGAIVAGLWLALDPVQLFFHGLALTEVAFICALLWGSVFLLRAAEQAEPMAHRAARAAAAGAVLGLGALTRSSSLLLPFLLLPMTLLVQGSVAVPERRPPAIPRVALAAAFLAAYVLMLVPTGWRNYRLLGQWVPVRTGGGATLLEGLGPWADGGPAWERVAWPDYPPGADELERDRLDRRKALDWARENPDRALDLAWRKLRRTWSLTFHAPGYEGGAFRWIGWTTTLPVYLLAVAGAWRLRRDRRLLFLMLAPALYFSAVHCVFVGSVRYRVPFMPGLYVLAAAALAALVTHTRRNRSRQIP